jgi:hypothetical protein
MWKRIGKLNLFSLVGLTLLLGALPASAAEAGEGAQHVINVGYSAEWAEGELNITLPTGEYYADVGVSAGCGLSVPTVETVRNWQSLAQSALLSGKTVSVGYSDCGGFHYIQWLGLNG